MYCTDLTLVQHEGKSITAQPLYCRCWSCEICAPRRGRELRWLARSGEPTKFLTLTVNPRRGEGPHHRAQELRDAWRWLRRKLRERFPGHRFEFLAVFEATEKGEPHLHIAMRAPYVDQRWLSEPMAARIAAPIVDIRAVRDQGRVAWYIAKYMGKAPTRWEGCKRYWRSQGWQLWQRARDLARSARYYILRRPYDAVLEDQRTSGITVADCVRGPPVRVFWWLGVLREGPA